MNKLSQFIFCFVLILNLFGCVFNYGPSLRNEYSHNIELNVYYEDGTKKTGLIYLCQSQSLGKENSSIKKIEVLSNRKVIHKFNKADVEKMLEKEKSESGDWVIEPKGVRWSTDRECWVNLK